MAKLWRRLAAVLLLAAAGQSFGADFELQDISGKSHRLADYRGKWVLVNFWATWCPPCLTEIPELNGLHDARSDMVVIGVAMDSGTRSQVADFSKKQVIRYPVVMGDRKAIAQLGQPDVLPTSYLYAPSGKLVAHQAGEVSRKSIEAYIGSKKFN